MGKNSENNISWWKRWRASWLNRGLVAAFCIVVITYPLIELLWIFPHGGGDMMGANVRSMGRFFVQCFAGIVAVAIFIVWFLLNIIKRL